MSNSIDNAPYFSAPVNPPQMKDVISMIIELLKKSALFIVLGIVIILFLVVNNNDDDTKDPASEFTPIETSPKDEPKSKKTENQMVIVDVKGEVMNPGVYEIDGNTRVHDVIQLAGGFSEHADQSMVNLAQKVQDEMVITIPKMGELSTGSESGSGLGSPTNSNDKVKLNYATKEEIEGLNGIGPSKAQAIVQYREENGFFHTVEDLLDVSGIGEKTLENLKDDIQVP
ncbi:helix-hairpin-helix domain-containing protein [Lentibacillus sp. Marseille-P4043]|uniref:helix-hairpin-helix domain-containing protein n=1 Tax=Lentibacillus sp. Marseille-P4043 TaxID=2040293 RepID=UPI001F2FCB11|nr:helix-hairpin-helix domain-containing protein [Lentibacillus sp. Marseille-P4043]